MYPVYLFCAAIGGTLLVVQLVFSLFGLAHDADGDLGGTVGDHDPGMPSASWFVGMLSLRALVGAVTFFGLGGMAGTAAGYDSTTSFLIAVACGVAALYLVAALMGWLSSLQSEGTVRIERAVGATGTVYLPVPRGHSGQGKVTLTLQNRTVEYAAVTPHAQPLPVGSPVVVTAVVGPDTVEVMPQPEKTEVAPDA